MQPSSDPQSGDRIVRELDVVVCAGALGSGTQVGRGTCAEGMLAALFVPRCSCCWIHLEEAKNIIQTKKWTLEKDCVTRFCQTVLLQYPLRGADRPYQLNGFEDIRYKPQNQKLQVDVSIDTNIPEYNHMADPARQLKKMSLESTSVGCPTSMAAAFVEGDRLILMPLDEVRAW